MAVLERGMLGRQLQLYKHHVIPNTEGQGQRRAARQEVTDLGLGQTFQGLHNGLFRPRGLGHEASFHRGHERQLAPIPHAEFLQLPRTEPGVFVKQRQAFLGYFEALGQPFAQPFHGLVMGHRQVVAGPRGAVDRQAHGCGRLRGRAQLAGAAGGPAPAAPGAAGLRLHPRRAQENWGPAGRLQSLPGLPR